MDRVDEILYLYEDDVESFADGGRSGFPRGGSVKPLDKEQQKLWDELNPDLEWKDYKGNRGNWKFDFKRKKKILDETRGLISEEKLAEILTEELGEKIDKTKITGKFGKGQRTQFAQIVDDLLYKGNWGSIKGGDTGGSVRYFKNPSVMDIKKILKADVLGDVRINALKSNTLKNVIALDKEFKKIYRSGNVPDIADVLKLNKKMGTKMTENSAGVATARLAQIYNGHKFRNTPEGIRVNKKAADGMFKIMNNSPFGNPYRNGLYKASMQTIDTALGNKGGTFEGLKKQAKEILIKNKIPIYSPEIKDLTGKVTRKGKAGFNINEIPGVTGSAKSKNVAVSQFIDIMEGNLNQKTLAQFQGQLSKARQLIEEAKGTKNYKSVLSTQSKKLNARAKTLEGLHDVKLPRLADPDALKSLSTAQIKRLESQTLGTGENLYTRLVKDAERSGYSIKMPKGSITIKEFTELDNKKLLKFFKDAKIPCIKGEGGQCTSIADYQKGYNKLVQEGAAGSKPAINKLGKFTKGIRALGNVGKWTGYGLLAEAGFMVPFAVGDYAAGKSWKIILGNATDYGFGPILGQSEQEEFEAALPEGSAAVQGEEVLRIGEEMDRMEKQKVNPGYGRVGYRQKAEDARQNVYNDKFAEYVRNMQPFLRPSPHLEGGQFYDQELFNKAMTEGAEAREAIALQDAEREEKRKIAGEEDFMAAGGGIAGIRRPNAIPPESGPQPQGLENLKYYVTNT